MANFIQELKRRKVFRVAAVYAIVAWLIIQIGEATFEALNLPSWALTLVIILLFTGFPIAIIFAWIFDRTPGGKIQLDKQDLDLRPVTKKKPTLPNSNETDSPTTTDDVRVNDKSIAVLPFTCFSDEKDDSYFADGITDVILTQLSKIKDLKVISRTSSMHYKNTEQAIKEIAQELGVASILEGSIQRAGNRIRIVSQLINTKTDEHLWAETYDREYADIFGIQSDVAKKIATALKATLTPEEIDYIDEIPTDNLEAYDYFLKGKHFWDTYITKDGNQKAVDMFDKATELDPNFAIAYAWASITHSALYSIVEWDHSAQRKELAKSTLDQAIALAPDHPKIHYAKGMYQNWCLSDIHAAQREFEIARNEEPNNAELVTYIGGVQAKLGNWEKAEEAYLKAYELDPLSFLIPWKVGGYYHYQRQFQKADQYYKLAIQVDPEQAYVYSWTAFNYLGGYGNVNQARSLLQEAELTIKDSEGLLFTQYYMEINARDFSKALSYAKGHKIFDPGSLLLGEAYTYLGKHEPAQAEFESLRIYYEKKLVGDPQSPDYHSRLGQVYAHLGLKEKAIAIGQKGAELNPVSKNHLYGPNQIYYLAVIYILSGELELAIDKLEYLLSIPYYLTKWYLRLDPHFDPLRDNPRFQKLIAED